MIVYPTDSSYALGCQLGDKAAAERIRAIRQPTAITISPLVCRDLSEIATYAKVDNQRYRLLKGYHASVYLHLQATHEVPRRLQHPVARPSASECRTTPSSAPCWRHWSEPIMSCTLILPGDDWPLSDPEEIEERLANEVDLIIDGGPGQREPTTVLDLTGEAPQLIRQGLGDASPFL